MQHAYFGHPICLNDVCADFTQGVSVLLGKAGAGKTTLLKCIAGVNSPMQGVITLNGQPLRYDKATPVGMVFDDLALFERRTLLYSLTYPLRVRRVPKEQWQPLVQKACADWQIEPFALQATARRAPMALRVKVALARASLTQRQVLLLDNPLGKLPQYERDILFCLLAAHMPRMADIVLYATDSADEARGLNAPTLLLAHGYSVAMGTVSALAADPPCVYAAQMLVPLYNLCEATAQSGRLHSDVADLACRYPAVYEGHRVLVGIPPDKVRIVPDPTGMPLGATVWRNGQRYVQVGRLWAVDSQSEQPVSGQIEGVHLYDPTTEMRLPTQPIEEE